MALQAANTSEQSAFITRVAITLESNQPHLHRPYHHEKGQGTISKETSFIYSADIAETTFFMTCRQWY